MKTRLFFLLLFSVFVSTESCKKDKATDPDACATSYVVAVQDELTAVSNAAIKYGTSPTVANCNAYKTAYQNYINALKSFSGCTSLTGTDKQKWQEDLNEAETAVNQFTCQQ